MNSKLSFAYYQNLTRYEISLMILPVDNGAFNTIKKLLTSDFVFEEWYNFMTNHRCYLLF